MIPAVVCAGIFHEGGGIRIRNKSFRIHNTVSYSDAEPILFTAGSFSYFFGPHQILHQEKKEGP